MCLVNCAKTMDLVLQPPVFSEIEILRELIRAENQFESSSNGKSEVDVSRWPAKRNEPQEAVVANKPDFISVSTQWTRRMFQRVKRRWNKLQHKTSIRILTKTSQPLHVAAVIITCLAMYAMYPTTSTTTNTKPACSGGDPTMTIDGTSPQVDAPTTTTNKLALFGYLSTFAIQFGAQIWMTFVSGLALYFSLPRHIFGKCQEVLFPIYFLMNACLGLVKLFSFCHLLEGQEHIGTASFVQIVLISVATLIEAGIYLHLVDPLLNLMSLKHKFELLVGSGREVGYENQKELRASPAYQKVHKAFRRVHMIIAMGNLTTVACSFSHVYYMVQKIQLV